jgi:cbb3-type cytochrome oxidase maturation protein
MRFGWPDGRVEAMDIFYVITIAAIILGALGVWLFVWTLKSGQYEDMDGAAQRILIDDDD